jgi:hypothetical protein
VDHLAHEAVREVVAGGILARVSQRQHRIGMGAFLGPSRRSYFSTGGPVAADLLGPPE